MTEVMLLKILKMCRANYPDYNTDFMAKGVLWMDEFIKEPDDLMETAIRSCITFYKKFPTIADIRESIRDLKYEEQTKSKQIPWDVKRDTKISDKAFKFVAEGNTAEYMKSVDVTKLHAYAKVHFSGISAEMVRKNYSEFIEGYESMLRCGACSISRNQCITQGWLVKHWLDSKTGYVSNEMARCQKNIR